MKRVLYSLQFSRSNVSPTELGVVEDIDGLAPACETELSAAKGELLGLVVPLEVLAEVDVLEAVYARGERGRDADSAGNDAKWFSYLLGCFSTRR